MECPECEKSFGYVRIKNREWICRNCGTITKIKESSKFKNIVGI